MRLEQHTPSKAAENPKAYRGSFLLLLGSVVLNLLLLCFLVQRNLSQVRSLPDAPSAPGESIEVKSARAVVTRFDKAASMEHRSVGWESVYSDDPREYAANLRAIGCPGPTVNAIISAKLYSLREDRIARIASPHFLSSGEESRAARIFGFQEKLAIISEFDAMGREILGVRWIEQPPTSSDFVISRAVFRLLTGRTDEGGWEHLMFLLKRGEKLDNALSELPPIAALRERRRVAAVYSAAVNEVCTPAEQIDFSERMIAVLLVLERPSHGFAPRPDELKGMAESIVAGVPQLQSPGLLPWGGGPERVESLVRERLERAMQTALSPGRFEAWKISMDEDCQAVSDGFAEANREESLQTLYQVKNRAEQAWMEVLESNLGEDEKEARFAAIQAEARASLAERLPDSVLNILSQRHPYWMHSGKMEVIE